MTTKDGDLLVEDGKKRETVHLLWMTESIGRESLSQREYIEIPGSSRQHGSLTRVYNLSPG